MQSLAAMYIFVVIFWFGGLALRDDDEEVVEDKCPAAEDKLRGFFKGYVEAENKAKNKKKKTELSKGLKKAHIDCSDGASDSSELWRMAKLKDISMVDSKFNPQALTDKVVLELKKRQLLLDLLKEENPETFATELSKLVDWSYYGWKSICKDADGNDVLEYRRWGLTVSSVQQREFNLRDTKPLLQAFVKKEGQRLRRLGNAVVAYSKVCKTPHRAVWNGGWPLIDELLQYTDDDAVFVTQMDKIQRRDFKNTVS